MEKCSLLHLRRLTASENTSPKMYIAAATENAIVVTYAGSVVPSSEEAEKKPAQKPPNINIGISDITRAKILFAYPAKLITPTIAKLTGAIISVRL